MCNSLNKNRMKNVYLSIFALLFSVSVSYAQNGKSGLKGPKAKNYKHPKKVSYSGEALTYTDNERPAQGPKAKNAKPWDYKVKYVDPSNAPKASTEKRLMGPKAKNHKIWKD